MDSSKKSNKISDIVKLKQMLKKWRKQANSSANNTSTTTTPTNTTTSTTTTTTTTTNNNSSSKNKGSLSRSNSVKGITFLKRTLSFTDISTNGGVPKGFLAVHVGEEMKRFVIPMSYLSHQAFSALLKEAEEEFGFQQEGVLRIPCEVEVFENILRVVEAKNNKQAVKFSRNDGIVCGSSESQSLSHSHHPPSPMCR